MNIQDQIREYILTNFYVTNPESLSNEMSLLDQGIIDSTGVLEVVFFIESTFGIRVEGSELLPENLESIERIAYFVTLKMGLQAPNQVSSVQ